MGQPLNPLRVGVIGLGEVAQVIHLPILDSLPELFHVSAVCDISPTLLRSVGDRYRVAGRYADMREMFAAQALDCALVLNSDEYHSECVLAALEHGVHVLVEKPMCLNTREAAEICAARDRAGRVVMVGYMRRFAPAFAAAVQQLETLGRVNFVRVHDIVGRNRLMIDQTTPVLRPDDIPRHLMEERWSRGRSLVQEALGEVSDELAGTYRLLCGLGSHDLSALRELVGAPRRVAAARQWRGGMFITALLEYDDFVAVYETGVDEQLRFDAHIEVFGDTSSFRLQYDTPYIRHLPTVLESAETHGDSYRTSTLRPHLKDPYTCELEYFHRLVTTGGTAKTGPEDFAADLDLFTQIIRALEQAA